MDYWIKIREIHATQNNYPMWYLILYLLKLQSASTTPFKALLLLGLCLIYSQTNSQEAESEKWAFFTEQGLMKAERHVQFAVMMALYR